MTLIHDDHYGYDYHDDEDDKEGNHHDQQEQDDDEEIQPLTALSLWYDIAFRYGSQNPGTQMVAQIAVSNGCFYYSKDGHNGF